MTHFRICSHCIVYHSVDAYELVVADDDVADDDDYVDVDVEPTYSERLFDFVQVLIVDVDGFADNSVDVDVIIEVVFGGYYLYEAAAVELMSCCDGDGNSSGDEPI